MIRNKHIIRFSFVGLFLNVLTNIVLYRYFMISEVVLKQVTEQHTHTAKIYKNRVWDEHINAVHKMQDTPYTKLLQDQEFIDFLQESSQFFKNIGSYVYLYDHLGKNFFLNNTNNIMHVKRYTSSKNYISFLICLDKYFLQHYITKQPLSDALQGKTAYSLVPRAKIIDRNYDTYEKSYISSYIPIIESSMGGFNIVGVIKITTDITNQWNTIIYLETRIFIAFVIVFLVFFIIVMYNTNYAQHIIDKQVETNRELHGAKTRAETESSAKTDFLANISHELRTPLNAIIGFSEIIMAETYGKIGNNQYKSYISDINSSGKHLLSVINDILDYSKASVDKLKPEQVELDLNKLTSSSMRFVKPRADEAKVQLIQTLPKSHIIIIADPKRLKQALLNLLSNAVKFTMPGGSVTLSLSKDNIKKLVHIVVTDTGIGMNDYEIPKALSSFGQVDNKLSRKYEGTGLGLPLTKKLIELMGGSFDMQSKPGKGTTVIITFKYHETILM